MILSVPLWVVFVASGGAIGAYLVVAGTVVLARRRGTAALAAAPVSMSSVLLAAGALVVMYVVLGIALWVSLLGALASIRRYRLEGDAVV